MKVASVGRSIIFVSSDSGSGPFIVNNREGGSAFGEGLRLTKNSKSLPRPLKSIVWTGRDLSLAYRWIQHSPSFKDYAQKIIHWHATRI